MIKEIQKISKKNENVGKVKIFFEALRIILLYCEKNGSLQSDEERYWESGGWRKACFMKRYCLEGDPGV